MANPTPDAINSIKNYINSISGGFTLSDSFLVNILNNPSYTGNPTPQPFIFNQFNSTDIFSVLSSSSVKNILMIPSTTTDVLPLLNIKEHQKEDIYWLNVWSQAYMQSNNIQLNEYVSITGIINKTILDPLWPSSVSWSQIFLGRLVDSSDIEIARN